MEILYIIVLSLSGLMLSVVGAIRLSKPIKSYCLNTYSSNPGIKLEGEADVFSEMRGGGSLTLFGGFVILLGIFIPGFKITSFVVAALIFLSFAVGRLIGMVIDGKPNKDLFQGTIAEILLGGINLFCLISLLIK